MNEIPGAPIIPTMRYRDPRTALEFLKNAFAFREHNVISTDDQAIVHAELTFGRSMIMLGPAADDDFARYLQPPTAGAAVTMNPYIIVPDADEHHARAVAGGAKIVLPPEDQDYGGRLYVCRDIEDQLWSFGTYDPWTRNHG